MAEGPLAKIQEEESKEELESLLQQGESEVRAGGIKDSESSSAQALGKRRKLNT